MSSKLLTKKFTIPHPSELRDKRGDYAQPKELMYYSINSKRELLLQNNSELKEYTQPLLGSDLNSGFDQFIKKTDQSNLDGMLKSLMYLDENQKLTKNFQFWRGIITKFMIAPYTKDSWEIYIQKKDSKIYMTELKLPEYGSDLKSQKFTFYGYKFESLCTSSSQVNTNIEYCSVFSSRFGNIRVILGGEVDCIQDKEYIELKTSRVLDSKRSVINFSRKLIRIWAQSYLVGISKIIFGFRNDDGILKDLKTYNTHEIASIAKSKGDWNRNSCLHFTETLLNWLLTETCDQSSYTLSKTNDTLELKECNDTFIPNWYSIQS